MPVRVGVWLFPDRPAGEVALPLDEGDPQAQCYLGVCFQNGSYARFTSTTPVNDLDVIWQVPDEAFAVNLEEIAVALASLRARVVLMNIPDLALAPAGAHLQVCCQSL